MAKIICTGVRGASSYINYASRSTFLKQQSYIPLFSGSMCGSRKQSTRQKPDVSHIPELQEPPLKKYYQAYYQPEMGIVYSKKPFKFRCVKGKTYYWCSCGYSHDQPFCDGREVLPESKIKMKPVPFKPTETREYWFCNCKQTKNRPFCDGSHNCKKVQESHPVVRY